MKQLKALALATSLLTLGCQAENNELPVYISSKVSLADHLAKPIDKTGVKKLQAEYVAAWDYEFPLKQTDKPDIEVNSCQQMVSYLDKGYQGSGRNYSIANALGMSCRLLLEVSSAQPSKSSHLATFNLDENFPSIAPPQMAMVISNDDKKRLEQANSWADMASIRSVERLNSEEVIYRDTSGGIQRVEVYARGDFNRDGVEDLVLYLSNNVEGGSYSYAEAFILTKLSVDAHYTLLKSLK